MKSRIYREVARLQGNEDFIVVGSMGWRETMGAGVLSYPRGLNCWLLMYFHQAGAVVQGKVQSDPGWYLWEPGAAQEYGRPDATWLHSWLHLGGTGVVAGLREAKLSAGKFLPSCRGEVLVDTYMARLFDERSLFDPPSAMVLGSQVASLVAEIARTLPDRRAAAITGELPESVIRAKRFLDANWDRAIALEELAREAGVSVPHLCALFKQAYGEPPGRYHLRLRMELAAFFLSDRGLPVGEVAQRIGYCDIYSFSRMFKRVRGLPPSAVRSKVRG